MLSGVWDESEVPHVIRLKYLLGRVLNTNTSQDLTRKTSLWMKLLGHEGFILKSAGDRVKEMLLFIYC